MRSSLVDFGLLTLLALTPVELRRREATIRKEGKGDAKRKAKRKLARASRRKNRGNR